MDNTKIDAHSIGLSVALVAALFWGVYSSLALMQQVFEVYMSGFYGYTDLNNFDWQPELSAFFRRLVWMSLGAGAAAWLTASLYNRLNELVPPRLR